MTYRILIALMVFSLAVIGLAQDEPITVVASHSILADVVHNVAGDQAAVSSVMPVGADPHSFEASPSDLTALANADVIFVNGALFEEGLLESIENAGEGLQIIEASQCVEIIAVGQAHDDHDEEADEHDDHDDEDADDHENHDDEHDEDDDEHEEGDDHEREHDDHEDDALCDHHLVELGTYQQMDHDHEHETLGHLYEVDCGEGHDEHEGEEHEEEHAHEAGSCDSHVWMNPQNVMLWTMLIRDTLIDADPSHADAYRANAEAYLSQLDSLLHDEIIPLVETLPVENRILITSHDSLGYLASTFDFEIIGTVIANGSTVAEPSVQDVASLIDLIQAEGVPAIFGETTVNDSIVQTIATETGADLVILYSGSLSPADEPAATYIDYIRYNYTAIVEALRADT